MPSPCEREKGKLKPIKGGFPGGGQRLKQGIVGDFPLLSVHLLVVQEVVDKILKGKILRQRKSEAGKFNILAVLYDPLEQYCGSLNVNSVSCFSGSLHEKSKLVNNY